MKNHVKIIITIIVLVAVSLPIEHYYCDNIYGLFAFSNSSVVRVDENTYRCPKDNPDVFVEYMKDNGWTFFEQMGSGYFFEKDGKKHATAF